MEHISNHRLDCDELSARIRKNLHQCVFNYRLKRKPRSADYTPLCAKNGNYYREYKSAEPSGVTLNLQALGALLTLSPRD